jgi:hydrogenase expression/formation protein HypD
MNYIDEFRRKPQALGLLSRIRKISTKKANIMEICGTHTHSVSKYGIRDALPANIRLISGPGCPVCVTAIGDINRIIELTRKEPDVIIATFGDMMRVPGTESTLAEERARGADIRVVYSPLNAIEIAMANPGKEVVLYAVGFETTSPTVAATIISAKEARLKNLSVLALHKLTPPAMSALIESGEIAIDGFICPGHVTAIIGARAYEFLSTRYRSPCVVAGFEPLDVLLGLYMLIKQIEEGRSEIEIEYDRVVTWDGNRVAREAIETVFTPKDAVWRGIGEIPASGLGIRDDYAEFDAEKRFSLEYLPSEEPKGCECGPVLRGVMTPPECGLFGKGCTPESPVGPCMVSSEGTCAAYYNYRGLNA